MATGNCYYCGKDYPLRQLKVDADPLVFYVENQDDEEYDPPEDRWEYICCSCIPKRRREGVTWIYAPDQWRAFNGPKSYASIYGS